MEYKFKTLEHNGLRGKIGEQVAKSFVRNVLAAKLVKEEQWDHVVLSNNDYKQRPRSSNTKLFTYDSFREDFVATGFFADTKLLSKYASTVTTLERNHCTPDGLLLKLKDTEKTKRVKESECRFSIRLHLKELQKDGGCYILPVVDGDLEVVEVKCGRSAKLLDKQKETYNDLIAKGVPLRMIKVRIVSFDLNRFLVEERRYDRFL
jgi:hypothetical protein